MIEVYNKNMNTWYYGSSETRNYAQTMGYGVPSYVHKKNDVLQNSQYFMLQMDYADSFTFRMYEDQQYMISKGHPLFGVFDMVEFFDPAGGWLDKAGNYYWDIRSQEPTFSFQRGGDKTGSGNVLHVQHGPVMIINNYTGKKAYFPDGYRNRIEFNQFAKITEWSFTNDHAQAWYDIDGTLNYNIRSHVDLMYYRDTQDDVNKHYTTEVQERWKAIHPHTMDQFSRDQKWKTTIPKNYKEEDVLLDDGHGKRSTEVTDKKLTFKPVDEKDGVAVPEGGLQGPRSPEYGFSQIKGFIPKS